MNNPEREPLLGKKHKVKSAPIIRKKIVEVEPGTRVIRRAKPKLDRIPTELLFFIFDHLTAYQLILLSKVAKRFNILINSDELWEPLITADFPHAHIPQDSSSLQAVYLDLHYRRLTKVNQSELSIHAKNLFMTDICNIKELSLNAKKLRVKDLLVKINNRPLISIFSKNQAALDALFKSIQFEYLEKLFHPSRVALMSLLCNQKDKFIDVDFTQIKAQKLSLEMVEQFLLFACWLGYAEIVKHIIARRLQLDLNKKHNGLNYLELATIEQHPEIVDTLLGANVNSAAVADQKSWFMHGAARTGNEKIYGIYLRHGVDPNLEDITEESALECLLRVQQRKQDRKRIKPVIDEVDGPEIAYDSDEGEKTFVFRRGL